MEIQGREITDSSPFFHLISRSFFHHKKISDGQWTRDEFFDLSQTHQFKATKERADKSFMIVLCKKTRLGVNGAQSMQGRRKKREIDSNIFG